MVPLKPLLNPSCVTVTASFMSSFFQTLILDEPTSGMDVESRRKIWDLLLVSVNVYYLFRWRPRGTEVTTTNPHMKVGDKLAYV